MQSIQFSTQITPEQLYSLILQLSASEKMALANRLRAEVSAQRLSALQTINDDNFNLDEIVEEVKIVRRARFENKPSK